MNCWSCMPVFNLAMSTESRQQIWTVNGIAWFYLLAVCARTNSSNQNLRLSSRTLSRKNYGKRQDRRNDGRGEGGGERSRPRYRPRLERGLAQNKDRERSARGKLYRRRGAARQRDRGSAARRRLYGR